MKYVEKYGKNVRMWGALRWLKGNTPVKADNVTINAWSYDWIDPNASLKDGYPDALSGVERQTYRHK